MTKVESGYTMRGTKRAERKLRPFGVYSIYQFTKSPIFLFYIDKY